mmetsp:Transcript_116032/g.335072  ORF Transcript_116032/g.335072 Transcript_116032/m.335072 type:complete len:369 (-) Transcript_116032:593-1699(-)
MGVAEGSEEGRPASGRCRVLACLGACVDADCARLQAGSRRHQCRFRRRSWGPAWRLPRVSCWVPCAHAQIDGACRRPHCSSPRGRLQLEKHQHVDVRLRPRLAWRPAAWRQRRSEQGGRTPPAAPLPCRTDRKGEDAHDTVLAVVAGGCRGGGRGAGRDPRAGGSVAWDARRDGKGIAGPRRRRAQLRQVEGEAAAGVIPLGGHAEATATRVGAGWVECDAPELRQCQEGCALLVASCARHLRRPGPQQRLARDAVRGGRCVVGEQRARALTAGSGHAALRRTADKPQGAMWWRRWKSRPSSARCPCGVLDRGARELRRLLDRRQLAAVATRTDLQVGVLTLPGGQWHLVAPPSVQAGRCCLGEVRGR